MKARTLRLRTVAFIAGTATISLVFSSSVRDLCVFLRAATSYPSPEPMAVLDRTTWDFGSVKSGSKLQAKFRVGNRGGRRLILTEERTSCECVAAARPEIVVDPGMTRDLVLDLDTEGIQGSLSLETSYRSNDPQQPHIRLILLVDVVSPENRAAR